LRRVANWQFSLPSNSNSAFLQAFVSENYHCRFGFFWHFPGHFGSEMSNSALSFKTSNFPQCITFYAEFQAIFYTFIFQLYFGSRIQ